MTYAIITYLGLNFGILALLTVVIGWIGSEMRQCPKADPGLWVASLAIATSFAVIGGGGVVLAGLVIFAVPDMQVIGVLIATGVSSICLGLGFGQAMANLTSLADRKPA